MKHAIAFLFLFWSAVSSNAQSFNWAVGNGGWGEDRSHAVAIDNSGNVIVAGQLQGSVDYGAFTLNALFGELDAFVVKYDAAGNPLWGLTGGGFQDDGAYGVATDTLGNIYVTGTFVGSAVFGGNTIDSYAGFENDIFILALDPDGVILWVKSAGGDGYDVARGIAVHGDALFICGGTTTPSFFDSVPLTGFGFQDAFVARYTTDGTLTWVQAHGGPGSDLAFGIAAHSGGGAYITGYFQGSAFFGSYNLVNGSDENTDVFVAKLDASGNIDWAQSAGNVNYDEVGRAVAVDWNDNVYIAGDFSQIVNFGSQVVVSNGGVDAFVAKYDVNGTNVFAVNMGGGGTDRGLGVSALDTSIYVTGLFQSTAQFGTFPLTAQGGNDIWIARLGNANGTVHTAFRAGGSGNDAGHGIAATGNALAVTGDFMNTASFGTINLATNGGEDYFVAVLGPSMSIYPCPFTATLSSDTLTLCPNYIDVFSTGIFDSYQWLQNGVPIPGATNQNYLVNANTDAGLSFSVIVTLNGCSDTTESGYVNTLVFASPSVAFGGDGQVNGSNVSLCEGDTLVLTLLPPYTAGIQWFHDGAAIGSGMELAVTESGVYNLSSAPAECPSYTQQLATGVTVQVNPPLQPVLVFTNDTLFAFPQNLSYLWFLDNTPIANAFNDWLSPVAAGSYYVTVEDSGCAVPSSTFVYTSVAAPHGKIVLAYPNPVSHTLFLDLAQPALYRVVDLSGRCIDEGIVRDRYNVEQLANGTYLMKLILPGVATGVLFSVQR